MKKMGDEIYDEYRRRQEPGTFQSREQMRWKVQAGEPATPERGRLRRQCNPQGPIGYLLETAHLQASVIDKEFNILQWNQPAIGIFTAPYQHLRSLIRQAAARNRTIAAEGTREVTHGLIEIDSYATKAEKKTWTRRT